MLAVAVYWRGHSDCCTQALGSSRVCTHNDVFTQRDTRSICSSQLKVAVCGPGRAGKDTTALWLRDHTILRYSQSTSEAATRLCYEKLREKYGYSTPGEAFADRHNHRVEWANLIWEYNKPEGITLYQEMLATNDVLNGIRRAAEIHRLQEGLLDLTIWIDRDVPSDPSCEMTVDDADIVIRNYGSYEELYQKLWRLAKTLRILR